MLILACPDCGKRYRTDPRRIPSGGGYVRCPACKARIPVHESRPAEAPAPPSPAPSEARPEAAAPPGPAAEPRPAGATAAEPAAPPGSESGDLHVLAEDGLLAARDLDEVRDWIFEGRIWPDNLVFVPGDEAVRADAHPLTRDLFTQAREVGEDAEEKPGPPEALAEAAKGEGLDLAGRAEQSSGPSAASAMEGTTTAAFLSEPWTAPWPAPPAESEVDLVALRARTRMPGGVRAFGVLNLLLSLVLPPNPLGIAAAIGLLRGRAWGRTLTTAWAGLQILFLLVAWSGFTAALLARGALLSPAVSELRALRVPEGMEPLLIGVLGFGALGAYLVIQWSYLARPGVSARFEGDGERAALWAGWVLGWIYLSAFALGILLFVPRLATWAPLGASPAAQPGSPAVAPSAPEAAPAANRVYSADGRVSLEVPPRWTVTSVEAGPDAKLGLLLQGSRENPSGTLRVSAARPRDVDRMNRRFDKLEGDQKTLQSVEDVGIGDLIGRRIVLSSNVRGGVTGQVLLSLHDEERGYQFSCAATGPGFDEIRPECDRMAQSLLILRPQAAGEGDGQDDAAAAAPPAGGP